MINCILALSDRALEAALDILKEFFVGSETTFSIGIDRESAFKERISEESAEKKERNQL